ncbi:MAG: hypothetical protein ABJE47_15845 [bacterium]
MLGVLPISATVFVGAAWLSHRQAVIGQSGPEAQKRAHRRLVLAGIVWAAVCAAYAFTRFLAR